MIKRIIFVLLFAVAVALGGLYIMQEPGFAVFSYGDFSVELELIYFYFYTIALFIILYFGLRLLGYFYRLPRRMSAKRQQKHHMDIMQAIQSSMLSASEFNWTAALRTVMSHEKHSPIKTAQHFLAAEYANSAGMTGTRDEQVAHLRKTEEHKALANSMEARFMLEDGHAEKVTTVLREDSLDNLIDRNLLTRAYVETENTEGVERVLPDLHTHTEKSAEVAKTVKNAVSYLIATYDVNAQGNKLADMWKVYFKHIQSCKHMLRKYVRALCNHQNDVLAEQIIKMQLDQAWDEQLVEDYGTLKLDNVEQRIKQAENWLRDHKESASLLLSLGRMCKQQKLWGPAKSHLESSLSRRPLAATYAELASLHETLGENIEAQKCAKKGLHIATR